MSIKLNSTQALMEQLRNENQLYMEDALDLMQCVCNDVRWDTGSAVPACPVSNWETMQRTLSALTYMLEKIYREQEELLQERCAFTCNELQQKAEMLSGIKQRTKQDADKLDAAREKVRMLEQEKANSEVTLQELSALQNEAAELRANIRLLHEQIDQIRDTDLQVLRSKKQQLEAELKEQKAENDRFAREELVPAQNAVTQAVKDLEQTRAVLSQANRDRDEAESNRTKAEKQLQIVSNEIKMLYAQRTQMQERLEEVAAGKSQAENEMRAAEDQLNQMTSDAGVLRANAESARNSAETFRQEMLAPAQRALEEARAEGEKLRQQKEEAARDLEQQKAENSSLQQQINAFKTNKKTQDVLCQQSAEKLLEAEKAYQEASRKRTEADDRLAQKNAGLKKLLDMIHEAERQLLDENVPEMLLNLESRKRELEEGLRSAKENREALQKMETEIRETEDRIRRMKKKLGETKYRFEELSREEAELHERIEEAVDALAPLEKQEHRAAVHRLREREQLLRSTLDDLLQESGLLQEQQGAAPAFQVDAAIEGHLGQAAQSLDILQQVMRNYLEARE